MRAWYLASLVLVLVAAPERQASADPAAGPLADPWATMRGCMVVLERFASCSADRKFKVQRNRWASASPQLQRASPAEVRRRLRSWGRIDGRRAQCAAWSRRPGAPKHLGESSTLAKLAARGTAVRCDRFARKVDQDGWIPAALIDTFD